jgi:hypothetical protein
MNIHTELENKEIRKIAKLIRETPIKVDLIDRTMERYALQSMNTRSDIRKRSGWHSGLITAAAAVVIFTVVMGTGFISPTMATSMKQIPGMDSIFRLAGDLGLRTADEKGLVTTLNASDTHDGLTVSVPSVLFDGTRVSVGIQVQTSDNKRLANTVQGMIDDINLSINGESIQSYAPIGHYLGFATRPGKDDKTTILQLSDLRNQGGKAFPDTFELTLDFTVSGIQDPFQITIPVEKTTLDNLVLTPSISRKYENIHLIVEKIEFSPVTTNLTTRIELPKNMKIASSFIHSLSYDIFDEQGKKLQLIGGTGLSATDGNVLTMDTQFEPFASVPKSITIKPYKHVYKDNSISEFQLDSEGYVKVEYIPELEITTLTTSK